jgi:hypothetical protein
MTLPGKCDLFEIVEIDNRKIDKILSMYACEVACIPKKGYCRLGYLVALFLTVCVQAGIPGKRMAR